MEQESGADKMEKEDRGDGASVTSGDEGLAATESGRAALASELMTAKVQLDEGLSPAREKEISEAVGALKGIREVKLEKDAVHVIYDPLEASEKEIERAIRGSGEKIKSAEAERELPHPDLPS